MKRVFDLFFSALGLVILSPFLLVIALLIKVMSPGPVIFSQERLGLGGRVFRIFKFRSMVANAERLGGQITVGNDSRLTSLGRVLRACKVDELPQLWNVLRGDMSLVGPRPEVAKYVSMYTAEQRQVLNLRPGITDPASFAFFNEADLLAHASDPEKYYREYLIQEKIRINLEYASRANLWTDFLLILATLARTAGLHLNIFAWLEIQEPTAGRRV